MDEIEGLEGVGVIGSQGDYEATVDFFESFLEA
jgi:hypothetical protein